LAAAARALSGTQKSLYPPSVRMAHECELQCEHLFFADVSALKNRRCSARRELIRCGVSGGRPRGMPPTISRDASLPADC